MISMLLCASVERKTLTIGNNYLQDTVSRLRTRRVQCKPPFVYTSPATSVVGKPFNVSLKTVRSLHLVPDSFTTLTAANAEQVIVVTGASNNHFVESKGIVASAQKYRPTFLNNMSPIYMRTPMQSIDIQAQRPVELLPPSLPYRPLH